MVDFFMEKSLQYYILLWKLLYRIMQLQINFWKRMTNRIIITSLLMMQENMEGKTFISFHIMPVSYPELFWIHQYIYLLCILVQLKGPYYGFRCCHKCFQNLDYLDWCKIHFTAYGLRSFDMPCSRKFGLIIWAAHTDLVVQKYLVMTLHTSILSL